MSKMTEHTRGVVGRFLAGRGTRVDHTRRFVWQEGKNVLRLFPFRHKVTEWDLLRPEMGFTPDDVGKVVDLLVVPVVRYYRGGRAMNGLGRHYGCPLFREWCELPAKERETRYRERPTEMFAVNALDMNRVGDGILPRLFSKSEWLGERSVGGLQVTYGIFNLIVGYPLDQSSQAESQLEGPAVGLQRFSGYGEGILGAEGQDIVVFKRKKRIGATDSLVMDQAVEGGPVRVIPKEKDGQRLCVVVPPDVCSQVKDLLWLPELFPGWHSGGLNLPHPGDPTLVQRFIVACRAFAEGAPIPAPSEELPPTAKEKPEEKRKEEPTKEAPKQTRAAPAPARAARKAGAGLIPGVAVVVTDRTDDDGVVVETKLNGVYQRTVKGEAEVLITAEAQTEDRARALVEDAIQTQGTNVFLVPLADVAVA